MAEQEATDLPDPSEISDQLHEIAQLLRGTHHLGPEAQRALATLADELGNLLDPAQPPPPEAAPLVDSTAKVVEALRQPKSPGVLSAARARLQETVAEVESHAPGSADFARRLLDVLANLGI
jgi:hypothetical protein